MTHAKMTKEANFSRNEASFFLKDIKNINKGIKNSEFFIISRYNILIYLFCI